MEHIMEKNIKKQQQLAWWIALGMTGMLFTIVAFFFNMQYAINDDPAILRSLMGYETGHPATYQLFTHGLLVWPIHFLHTIWPFVPWYSYMQLALLFLSFTVISKSLMQCSVRYGKSIWLGAVVAFAFEMALGLEHLINISFTFTAGMLSAAAVAQLFSIDYDHASDKQIIWRIVGACGLVCLGYALRLDGVLPSIAWCGLSFVFLFWDHFGLGQKAKRHFKPMLICLVLIAVMLGGMVVTRQVETALYPAQDFLEWHQERTLLMDYYGLNNLPPEVLEQAGWDERTLNITRRWFLMDNEVTADTMRILNEYQASKRVINLNTIFNDLKTSFADNPDYPPHFFRMLWLSAALIAAAIVGALFIPGKRVRYLFTLFAIAGGFILMLFLLAFRGRIMYRATVVVALPGIVLLLSLLPGLTSHLRISQPVRLISLFAAILFAAVSSLPLFMELHKQNPPEFSNTSYINLESYALAHPDQLFLHDHFLLDDYRVFPNYPNGTPHNIAFWGGWLMRSLESEEQFHNFGIDIWNVDPNIFFRGDVFFVTIPEFGHQGTGMLKDWLEAKTGKTVYWQPHEQYANISIIKFYEK